MRIERLMTREVVSVAPGASVLAARLKMDAHGIRHLPVLAPYGVLVGIVSDRDIRGVTPFQMHRNPSVEAEMRRFARLRVEDIMTAAPHTVRPETPILEVLERFLETGVGAFPVVDEAGVLVGIISEKDVLRAVVRHLGTECQVQLGGGSDEAGR
jgi:CBS-domain-containing membrane protein